MTHFLSCVPHQFPPNLLDIYRLSSCQLGPSGVENFHLIRPSKIMWLFRLLIQFTLKKTTTDHQINNNKKKSFRIICVLPALLISSRGRRDNASERANVSNLGAMVKQLVGSRGGRYPTHKTKSSSNIYK